MLLLESTHRSRGRLATFFLRRLSLMRLMKVLRLRRTFGKSRLFLFLPFPANFPVGSRLVRGSRWLLHFQRVSRPKFAPNQVSSCINRPDRPCRTRRHAEHSVSCVLDKSSCYNKDLFFCMLYPKQSDFAAWKKGGELRPCPAPSPVSTPSSSKKISIFDRPHRRRRRPRLRHVFALLLCRAVHLERQWHRRRASRSRTPWEPSRAGEVFRPRPWRE